MIHILSLTARTAHSYTFDSMFEDRKRLFVDLLHWDLPVTDNRFEIDSFDTSDAVFIIDADEGGNHLGSLRLLPSAYPHILNSLFDDLCPTGVPTGDHIYEITRLCLPARFDTKRRLEIRKLLISAMVDYALTHGIKQFTGVVDARFRAEILSMGWLAEPLGPAKTYGDANLGAFAIHIAPDTPDRLRWTDIYQQDASSSPMLNTARVST